MKKIFTRVLAVAGAGALMVSLTSCGNGEDNGSSASLKVTVGASPVPHAKILKYLQDSGEAAKAGLDISVTEFTDYVQPNEALSTGDIDANFYQTVPYLENESESRGYKFEAGQGVHLEPLGIFSDKIKNLDELKDGATITVINDPSNQGRALKLLADNGLLKLDNTDASVLQIKSDKTVNPRGFKFHEIDGPALTSSLPDVDLAVINGNFAQAAGLSPKDALSIESPENNPAVNVLVWRKGEQSEAVKKLDELLHSDVTKKYIEETWSDKSVIPAF